MFFINEALGCPATFQRDRIPRLTQLSILVYAINSWSGTGFLLASLQPLPCRISLSCQYCSSSKCRFYKTLLKQRDCALHLWHKMDIMLDSGKTKNPDITTGLVQHLWHHKHIRQTREKKWSNWDVSEPASKPSMSVNITSGQTTPFQQTVFLHTCNPMLRIRFHESFRSKMSITKGQILILEAASWF